MLSLTSHLSFETPTSHESKTEKRLVNHLGRLPKQKYLLCLSECHWWGDEITLPRRRSALRCFSICRYLEQETTISFPFQPLLRNYNDTKSTEAAESIETFFATAASIVPQQTRFCGENLVWGWTHFEMQRTKCGERREQPFPAKWLAEGRTRNRGRHVTGVD